VQGKKPASSQIVKAPEFAPATETVETSAYKTDLSPKSINAPEAKTKSSHLVTLLGGMDAAASKNNALAGALSLWGVAQPIKMDTERELTDPEAYFVLTARKNGFRVQGMQSSLARISKLNLPAIFGFYLPGQAAPYFLTLSKIDNGKLTFLTNTGGGHIVVDSREIETLWLGLVYIPWVNFDDYDGILPINGSGDDVLKLKQLLETIGYEDLEPGIVYDKKTEAAIRDVQRRYAIPMDGLVGPLTKIALYNEQPGLNIPHVVTNEATEPKAAP
jgi:hypothetical protein